MIEALCIGHATWDISVWVPEYPAENSKSEIRELLECSGGPAANAACLLARWGVPTAFAGAVGEDEAGEKITAALTGFGVNLSLLTRSAGVPTPVSIITVSEQSGSRTIVNRKAAGPREPLAFAAASDWPAPGLLLFDGHECEASLDAMKCWPDAITMLDAGSLREGTRVLAEKVGCLAASERFVCQLLGFDSLKDESRWPVAIAALHRLNGNPVVITLGERGLIAGTEESWMHLPACPAKPVDTTGAGDIFHGALAYGLLKRMEWRAALELASAAAALSVEKRGSNASIPRIEEASSHAAPNPRA